MKKLTVGILAHVDAGKTTLSEALLYLSGQTRKLGRVDHQDTVLDTDEQERERGITIFSKQARLTWGPLELTLLDTPGHVDFSAEMERTLQVLDYAVLVVSGADGVQGHTATLWRLLEHQNIPTWKAPRCATRTCWNGIWPGRSRMTATWPGSSSGESCSPACLARR